MILFGDGERIVTFAVEERHHCECCARDVDFTMRLKYRYGHFYHLFGWVIRKQYQLVCPACEHGWMVNTASAEEILGGNPIPFHLRRGWIVGIVLLHLLAVAALLQPGGPLAM
jgi:hypothetical protein